jgi:hypothetical protein
VQSLSVVIDDEDAVRFLTNDAGTPEPIEHTRENRLSALGWEKVHTYIRTVTDKKLAGMRAWKQQQARDANAESNP